MRDYKNEPLWKKTCTVGLEIITMTETMYKEEKSRIIYNLHKIAQTLPITVAWIFMASDAAERKDMLRLSFSQIHQAEFLLFLSLHFGLLHVSRIKPHICLIHEIKRDLLKESMASL
jgi:hypothetical protein